MAQKLPVYELAKSLGVSNKELLAKIQFLGIEAKNHLARLEVADADRVTKMIESERQGPVLKERISSTVIRRRSRNAPDNLETAPLPQPEIAIVEPVLTDEILDEKEVEISHKSTPHVEVFEEDFNEEFSAVESDAQIAVEDEISESETETKLEVTSPPIAETPTSAALNKGANESRTATGFGPTGRVIDLSAFKSSTSQLAGRKSVTLKKTGKQEITIEKSATSKNRQKGKPSGNSHLTREPRATQAISPANLTAEHKRVVKMGDTILVKDFANLMGLKATDVLKKLWELGLRSIMINSPIDQDAAQLVAAEFGWKVESTVFLESSVVTEEEDQTAELQLRAPVVTIMGHVDHGKTSLLDAIRNADVASGEAGGITQHIGAYKIHGPAGDVVFLDTPGHEAFTEMRARGAQATDIVVLVVAADDGVMPQTVEALNHAKDAGVPIIVAVNKIDKPDAQPERIRQQLAVHGLNPEEWGGDTIYVDVSARTRSGVDKLLEMLAIQSEILELKANPDKAARGVVIEARMDSKKGPVATVLVQSGTLKIGANMVVGEEAGKVRAMLDDKGRVLTVAGPSTPVEILGLSGVPRAGDSFNAVVDERSAKILVEHRRKKRQEQRQSAGPVSLDKLLDAMKAGLKELKIILKTDVQGSAEAISAALTKISTPQVKVSVIQSAVGGITESDVNLAKAGNAIIIGFHVRPAGKAAALAEQEGVDIKLYDIIYEAIDDVKKATIGMLEPTKREKLVGKALVRQTFQIPKIGLIAGCGVTEGVAKRGALVRVIRDAILIHQGKLTSLKRFKEDVREVSQGYECGLTLENFQDLKEADVIEFFEIEEVRAQNA